jgi:hypothetical protein
LGTTHACVMPGSLRLYKGHAIEFVPAMAPGLLIY